MSAHVGLGPSSLADSFLLPGRFPRLSRAATSTRSHQRGFRLLYLTGHFEPRSVEQLRHGQAQHARPRSSLLLLHSGRLAVSSPLRGEPASSVTAHCRGATTTAVFCYRLYAALSEPCTSPRAPSCFLCHSPLSRSYYNRSSATGYTPRSVGPAHYLYKFLSSSPRVCAPLLRHPRVP